MSPRHRCAGALRAGRRGLTLVELMIAAGLASIVMLALMRLVDSATDLWTKGEQRRAVVEQAGAIGELVARDLRALHSGARGDLIVDWYPFDVDHDGRVERLWPRLRFVRSASPVDLARMRERAAADAARAARARREDERPDGLSIDELDATETEADPSLLPPVDLEGVGLMEVAWAIIPRAQKGEGRYEGLVVRGERLLEPNTPARLLAADLFDKQGRPAVELVEEITGGVLWFDVRLATQTTSLDAARPDGGWHIGRELGDATTSWDAYGLGRPDPDLHVWNEPAAGMPAPGSEPLLPRRIRIEVEIERERDLQRRTRLAEAVEEDAVSVNVENGARLVDLVGEFVFIDGEWMRVKSVGGDSFIAERAQRGTGRRRLAAGALVHHGEALVVEVPVALHRDDWGLEAEGARR
ncbi:MAG: prepilin-type N-terminal cleavage/methylation domain-containing protein [Planctomycetota bacterium]